MKRSLCGFLRYLQMIVLLISLSISILYFAGAPLVAYFTAKAKMCIIKGAPGYPHTDIHMIAQTSNTVQDDEIHEPAIGSQYGYIYCDRINLSAPIYYGDDEKSLLYGAGHYTVSGLPGSGKPILISAHDSTFFAELEQIEITDLVVIATKYGKFKYEVTQTKIIDDTDTEEFDLHKDEEILILYTCYPFGEVIGQRTKRFLVLCKPVS